MRLKINYRTPLLAATAAAIAIATAPCAWAAPSQQSCFDNRGPTDCHRPGNAQIVTSPPDSRPIYPVSHNPKYSGLGYNPKYPLLGHHPSWQEFGYNPHWDGFHHPRWKPTSCEFTRRADCPGGHNNSLLG